MITFLLLFCVHPALAEDWEELKGDHFIIYYAKDNKQGNGAASSKKFAKRALSAAEKYYKQIAEELGYARHSNFWQWENRAKITIYPDRESFMESSSHPGWSEGIANYKTKEIISYAWKEGFIESLLAHEIAHLIFRDFVGFDGEVPLWLDEGVAQWEELPKRQIIRERVQDLLKKEDLFELEHLMTMDIRESTEQRIVQTFYIQAAMLVGFMIETKGAEKFISFCRHLRDGKKLKDALKFAYPMTFRTIEDLEKKFIKHLEDA